MNAVGMASTKYVWPIGDKIRLLPGSMERIIEILNQDNIDLLVVNIANGGFPLMKRKNLASEPPNLAFTEYGSYLGLLGSFITPSAAWMRDTARVYLGNNFMHVGVIFDYLARLKHPECKILANPVALREERRPERGQNQGVSDILGVYIDEWKALINSLPDFYSRSEKESVTISRRISRLALISLRARGLYDSESFYRYREFLIQGGLLSAELIAYCPVRPLRFLKLARDSAGNRLPGPILRFLGN